MFYIACQGLGSLPTCYPEGSTTEPGMSESSVSPLVSVSLNSTCWKPGSECYDAENPKSSMFGSRSTKTKSNTYFYCQRMCGLTSERKRVSVRCGHAPVFFLHSFFPSGFRVYTYTPGMFLKPQGVEFEHVGSVTSSEKS